MRKDTHQRREPKGVYRVRNWSAYNAGLINRGNVTMWIEQSELTQIPERVPHRRGRPCVYSDSTIQMLLALKQVFRLPLRALQGFAQSQRDLAFADLPVPNYTTVCRRAQTLAVKLPVLCSGEALHLRAIASRDMHSKRLSPIVFIESGLEPLVLYADLGGFVSAQ